MSALKEKIDEFLMEMTEQYPDLSIQVLATYNEAGKTLSLNTGLGNWYARQGLAHEFINADIAQENARQLSELLPKPPQD